MSGFGFNDDEDVVSERSGGVEVFTESGGALAAITKSEVDMQITTAKRYPREIRKAKAEAHALATLDEETAQSMFYALPRGGKNIVGPSARLAEVVVYSWGNIRAQAIITDVGDKFVTAMGTVFDLEKNVATQVEVRRRITDSKGRRFNDDMIQVTGNAAASIAFRNAVFKVIPFALVKPIYEAAMQTAVGKAESMVERRRKASEWCSKIGVSEEQMLAAIGRNSMEEITNDDLIVLAGIRTAIKDGDTTIEEAFSPGNVSGNSNGAHDLNERLRQRKATRKEEPAAEKPKQEPKAESKPEPEQKPEPAKAEDAQPEPDGRDVDLFLEAIENLQLDGGDATKKQRTDLKMLAVKVFGSDSEEAAATGIVADASDLGQVQAESLLRLGRRAATVVEQTEAAAAGADLFGG